MSIHKHNRKDTDTDTDTDTRTQKQIQTQTTDTDNRHKYKQRQTQTRAQNVCCIRRIPVKESLEMQQLTAEHSTVATTKRAFEAEMHLSHPGAFAHFLLRNTISLTFTY